MSLNLRSRVRIILVIAAILPTLAIGTMAIYRANTEVESEVIRGRLNQVRALAASLDETLQGARRSLELAAAWWADERGVYETDSPESKRVMHRLWRRLRREVPMFSGLSILDVDGHTLFGGELAVDPSLGAHSFGGLIGDVALDDGKPYVPVVTQARSRTGERIGLLVARLDLSFIGDSIDGVPLGTNARLIVLDGNGKVIADSDGRQLEGDRPDTAALTDVVVATALGRVSEGQLRIDGKLVIYRNLVAFQNRRALSWALILEQPESDAFALGRRAALDTSVIALLVLGLALVVGAILASKLTRPLALLAKRADSIAEGQIDRTREPIEGPGEIGILGRRLEEMAVKVSEREQLQAALAHEDRLATIGTMAASVAHEINNPLTTILGYSSLMMEDMSDENPDRGTLQLISEEAARMKTIIAAMLEYSRNDSGQMRSSDLSSVLRRVHTLLLPALKKMKVELVLELGEIDGRVAAGEQSLQQIFVNLIQNAAQAMPEGGRAFVRTRQVGESAHVSVCDEGPGIPEEERSQVFEAFYTTKKPGQGTGLGLAVVKHLVGEFRGSVRVVAASEDVENANEGLDGTCMKLVIPMLKTAPTSE